MSFLDLVKTRQSVRKYSAGRPVEREKIERCIEAARLAPSACNSQPWRFIVVDDPGIKDAVARETFGKLVSFNHFSQEAPVLVVMVTEKPNMTSRIGRVVKNRQYYLIDIGIAAEHFCLQAAELSLGTCLLSWFNEEGVKKLLGVPKRKRIDLIIAVGYPLVKQERPKKRKETDLIRSYNRY